MDNPRASHERTVSLKESKNREISHLQALRWCLMMLLLFALVATVGIAVAYYYLGYISTLGG